jgi:phenylacetate-CoA ligase
MMKRLCFLREAQWWDVERINSARSRLLSEVVATSYQEVPFYRQLMDRAGVVAGDIKGPADLQKLPIVTKDMLREAYPNLTTRNTGQHTYEKRTSGSTGKNFVVLEDPATAGWYRASFMLALEWSGWKPGTPHLQTGMTFARDIQRRLKDTVLRCHYMSAAALADVDLDRSLGILERHSIKYLWGYPGSLYHLARRARQTGWNLPLRSVVTWGDNLYAGYRSTIEQAFSARVYDTYGCAEGVQVSAQCGTENNYHIHPFDVVVEYVDEDGQPVAANQPGTLLLTRLHAGPMPLIRYRIGDIGTSGEQSPCPCGRGYPRMSAIEGRDTDIIVTPSGNRLIVHFFTGYLEHFSEIESFQVRQDDPSSITLLVVPTNDFTPETADRIRATLQRGSHDPDMRIDIEPVNAIPMTAGGKRRFVISSLSQNARAPSLENRRGTRLG